MSLLKFHNDIALESVTSPIDALSKINENEYDLFIVDYLMDEMNGMQLIEKIRSIPSLSSKKCILLTAKDLNDSELNQLNELKGLYSRKPIMPNEFYKQIVDVLNND